MTDLTRKLFAAETATVNQHLNPSSTLDEARAELQRHAHGPAFVAALEHFEAAVRANERAPRQPIDEEQAAALLAPLEAKARQMREHREATLRAAVLREAADRIDNEELPQDYVDMFDNGARWAARLLRRIADEAQQQAGETPATTEAEPVSCAHCGKTVRRITGTLTAWWVHVPGGQAMCQPWQPARSTRATPKPAAGARQDGAQQP